MNDIREASIAAVGLRVAEMRKAYADMVYHQLKGWVGRDALREDAAEVLDRWQRRSAIDSETYERVLSMFDKRREPAQGKDFLVRMPDGALARLEREMLDELAAAPTRGTECDAENPPVYAGLDGTTTCRCVVCGRCGRHTGNSNQGHFWAWCKATKSLREFHFCCPGNCALEVAEASADADQAEVRS